MARMQFRLPSIRTAASGLAVALVAVSLIAAVSTTASGLLLFTPGAVLGGFAWQLLSYGFIEVTPLGVIFGTLITWSLGGALEYEWGRKRVLFFSLGAIAAGSVCTLLLSLVWPSLQGVPFAGGSVLTGALWVAYGLQIGSRQTNFWGMPVTGNALAGIGVGFLVLNAVFARSIVFLLPEAFALAATFLSMRGFRPTRLLARWRTWRFEKQYEKRSAHLRSIEGGRRNVGGDSDRYLH